MKWCKVLVCACFGISIVMMSGALIPGSGSPHAAVRRSHSAASDTTKDKIREAKERLSTKVKTKRGQPDRRTEETRYEEVKEEKTSFWGSCLGDLLGSLCSGMLSSALEGDDEVQVQAPEPKLEQQVAIEDATTETPPGSDPAAAVTDTLSTLPYAATIMPLGMHDTVVLLWDAPGGDTMQATTLDTSAHAKVLDTLEMGTEVSVIKISLVGDTFWVKVETADEPKVIGWIREREASPIEMPDSKR